MKKDLYFSAKDGVHLYRLCEDGTLQPREHFPYDEVMYLAYEGGRMFVLLRAPGEPEDENSAVIPVYTDPNGYLIDPCPSLSTQGRVGCHLSLVGDAVYAANYVSGSISKMPLDGSGITTVTHEGRSVHPTRQDKPHTHYIAPTPDGKYLAVTDLGLDKIFVYDMDLRPISEVMLPAGSGPRHLAYSSDGQYAYCADELSAMVSVLSYSDGRFTYLADYDSLPENARASIENNNISAAIRFYDGYVYVSSRGHDSVTVFRADGAHLLRLMTFSCGGAYPRDIDLFGDHLVCTNERSDSVTVFRLSKDRDSAEQVCEVAGIPAPIAVLGLDV
ncbi:MAG: beta-propeller fold lactonase family protein [Clostridia bacterium]|nr:beta-propeller fold lactonase family protein [Clostridia bacterium]